MKSLKTFTESINKFQKIVADPNAVNYLSEADLKKYLEVAHKFLSEETRDIINYLIVNNKTYIADLSTDNEENAISGFYNAGIPEDEKLKELWQRINTVVKSKRILEIPTLQTRENFDKIINVEIPADKVILDIDNPASHNGIVEMYTPLMHKICKQWMGKSTLTYDDLYSAAQTGILYALDNYGKKTRNEDYAAVANYTFGQYAAMMIRNAIIGDIRTYSHTVAIPINKQAEERKAKGYNAKSHTISGDKKIGINNSDEGNKTIFDFIETSDEVSTNLNNEDINKLWKEIWDELDKNMDKNMMEIFYSFYGLNGRKKLKNKELSAKFGVSNSSITYYCFKVRQYISTHKSIINKCKEIYSLMVECAVERDNDNNRLFEPLYI